MSIPVRVPYNVYQPIDRKTEILSTVLSLTHRHGHRRQHTATYNSLCQNRGNNCGHPEQRKILKLTSDRIHCRLSPAGVIDTIWTSMCFCIGVRLPRVAISIALKKNDRRAASECQYTKKNDQILHSRLFFLLERFQSVGNRSPNRIS